MTTTLELDSEIIKRLKAAAKHRGVSVEEFLKICVPELQVPINTQNPSQLEEVEAFLARSKTLARGNSIISDESLRRINLYTREGDTH